MRVYHSYYYTFEDMAKTYSLETFMHNYYQESYVAPSWYTRETKDYIEKLWTRLKHMFYRKGIYFNILDVEYNTNNSTQYQQYLHEDDSKMRIEDLLATIGETSTKYIEIIKKQNILKATVVEDIVNESSHYFNDTPQSTGSMVDVSHTTTFSRDTQKTSLGPVSAKLEEVEKAMDDKYDLWLREFKKFIIVQENA